MAKDSYQHDAGATKPKATTNEKPLAHVPNRSMYTVEDARWKPILVLDRSRQNDLTLLVPSVLNLRDHHTGEIRRNRTATLRSMTIIGGVIDIGIQIRTRVLNGPSHMETLRHLHLRNNARYGSVHHRRSFLQSRVHKPTSQSRRRRTK